MFFATLLVDEDLLLKLSDLISDDSLVIPVVLRAVTVLHELGNLVFDTVVRMEHASEGIQHVV